MFKKTVHNVVVQKLSNMANLELVKRIFLLEGLKLFRGIFVNSVEILFPLTERVRIFILPSNTYRDQ